MFDKSVVFSDVFALGGAVGGFTAGYYWRRLIAEKAERRSNAS